MDGFLPDPAHASPTTFNWLRVFRASWLRAFLLFYPFLQYQALAQPPSNCAHPVPVHLCPAITFTNETNAGEGDNGTTPCDITGEDKVYEIFAQNGADKIHVSIQNATAPLRLFLETAACGSGSCASQSVGIGDSQTSFTVSSATYYYLWVDAAVAATWDITIGGDTANVWVNLPNTQGNLQFDYGFCASPVFSPFKPFFQVTYNNVFQTDPMTLAPLFVPGVFCISIFLQNLTGIEGVRTFDFQFPVSGFAGVSTAASIPGFYNAGTWTSSNISNTWRLEFADLAGLGKGDFTGSPNACLQYDFCFNLTPLSNDPALTNIMVTVTGDGFGAGFSGWVVQGCCPPGFGNCGAGGGTGGGPGSAFGFGLADPGVLPVELSDLNAEPYGSHVRVSWVTLSEKNCDHFTVERSPDFMNWGYVTEVPGAGNSTTTRRYAITDPSPFTGRSYYRLKQTDFDGSVTYAGPVDVFMDSDVPFRVYPNPSGGLFTLLGLDDPFGQIRVYDLQGRLLLEIPYQHRLDLSEFSTGSYLLWVPGSPPLKKLIIIE